MGKVFNVIKADHSDCSDLFSLREEIEQFSRVLLREYNDKCITYKLNNKLSYKKSKSFFDSVWGTIELNEGEIFLIDSPVIQRLRKIKQLGLVDLLFSSANHSRFSHMLGVLFASTMMANQISRELEREGVKPPEGIVQIIRISAIFHDCGHLFCSHASERFFQDDSSSSQFVRISNVRNYFLSNLEIKPSISEIISALILNSGPMRELFSIINNGFENLDFNEQDQDSIIERIACFIFGYPYTEADIPYSQVINGQIDADKIDYLIRDAHSTGIPSAIDTSRIIQKIKVSKSPNEKEMISKKSSPEIINYQFAIAPSAINTIDQLMISRFMMFENVYFHPKTASSETYFRYALSELDASTKGLLDNFANALKLDDNDLLSRSSNIDNRGLDDFHIVDKKRFNNSKKILRNIYSRYLLKRSVSLGPKNLIFHGIESQKSYEYIFDYKIDEFRVDILNKITEKFYYIYKELFPESPIDDKEVDILLMFSPEYSNMKLNSNVLIADKKSTYRDDIFEADNWLKSRTARDRKNYILTNEKYRYLVYLATELVLFENYGIELRDLDLYSNDDEEKINRLRIKLVDKGIYENALPLIHLDEMLTYENIFQALSTKWRYDILNPISSIRTVIDKYYISSFLMQFYIYEKDIGHFEIFLRESVDLLKNIRIISNNDIEDCLEKNIHTIRNDENCSWDDILLCCLGNIQDSSSQIGYHVNVINKKLSTTWVVKKIDEIEEKDLKPIIICLDDGFYSGTQILSMFQSLDGIPLEEREVQENHLSELKPEIKEKLKKTKIYLSLLFKNADKEMEVKEKIESLGFSIRKIYSSENFPKPYLDNLEILGEKNKISVIKRYFQKAGEDLIKCRAYDSEGVLKENWSDSRIKESTLGYENAQQLIVFPWNCPTYTITALWMSASNSKFVWNPLFPRIDKKFT